MLLQVESASLPVATFAKFQPHSVEFLDMTNPKAVLEARLRNFACLSKDDVIAIQYNDKVYEMSVLETKPANAVSVIECDLNVDFAPPVGYQVHASWFKRCFFYEYPSLGTLFYLKVFERRYKTQFLKAYIGQIIRLLITCCLFRIRVDAKLVL